MKKTWLILIIGFISLSATEQELPILKISDNHRYIVTQDNKPFFWLGDTAWELIHRLTKEDIDLYLTDRAAKGFTIIQTVILAELDGLNTPNARGDKPLINNDPKKINEKYFELVDYVLKKANELGMYIGLLPAWGDKFNLKWGTGPVIFTSENAEKVKAFWFNPRDGHTKRIGEYNVTEKIIFKPWSVGRGSDFVLIIMGEKANYQIHGINN